MPYTIDNNGTIWIDQQIEKPTFFYSVKAGRRWEMMHSASLLQPQGHTDPSMNSYMTCSRIELIGRNRLGEADLSWEINIQRDRS